VVFIVENNGYAMGTSVDRTANHPDIWKLGLAYEMPSEPVDGMDPVAVAKAMDKAISHARSGKGPYFLEMKTYRYRGHSMSDAQKYRTKAEVAEYKKIDPISQVLEVIRNKKYLTEEQIQEINDEVKTKVLECERFADESPYPDKEQLYDMVYEQKDYPFIKGKI
jgi:pyruvate dehydrogenase E1 component alpha subunit